VLIAVLFNRTSSGGHSVGDISNEARRGHYQRGATLVFVWTWPVPFLV